MSAFILTMFILFIIAVLTDIARLTTCVYPRQSETNMGSDVVSLILNLALIAWATYLYWGQS